MEIRTPMGEGYVAAVILGRLQQLEILLEDPVTESSELVDFGAYSSPCIEESFGLEFQAMYLSKISQYNNRVLMTHQTSTLSKLENFMHARVASAIDDCPTQNSTLANTITRLRDAFSNLEQKDRNVIITVFSVILILMVLTAGAVILLSVICFLRTKKSTGGEVYEALPMTRRKRTRKVSRKRRCSE